MRLDIRYQPLDFEIYLSQVIDIPRTSIEEPPYNFQLELEALDRVDQIIERTKPKDIVAPPEQVDLTQESSSLLEQETNSNINSTEPTITTIANEKCNSQQQIAKESSPTSSQLAPAGPNTNGSSSSAFPFSNKAIIHSQSCPIETPLTPIKCTVESNKTTNNSNENNENSNRPADRQPVNQINVRDFEDSHYNPFDHLELQTIDERRELELVFQPSYADQANNKN